jgi:hypothetical protein
MVADHVAVRYNHKGETVSPRASSAELCSRICANEEVSNSPDPTDSPHTRYIDLFCVIPIFVTGHRFDSKLSARLLASLH